MRNPVIRWTLLVFSFWWLVLYVLGPIFWPEHWVAGRAAQATQALTAGIAALLGVALVIGGTAGVRHARLARLAGVPLRGLTSTLGPVPQQMRPPKAKEGDYQALLPNEATRDERDTVARWFKHYETCCPRHIELASYLLGIYAAKPDLPCTHHADGHGGRTLFAHVLSVAVGMLERADGFQFDGLRNRKGRLLAPLQKVDYRFHAVDPMIFLIGLAHDIGKIEGFVWSEGRIVDCKKEHDMIGMRMLGRMPLVWALPPADREALLLAVGHYHHGMQAPLDREGRLLNDRGTALMTLLIRADLAVSAEEDQDDYNREDVDEISLYEAFVDVVSQVNRINGSEKGGSIGQKYGELVVFHEQSLRRAVAEHLNRDPNETAASGEFAVTEDLIVLLHERGLLEGARGVQGVEFLRNGEKFAGWSRAVIIRPARVLPGLGALQDYDAEVSLKIEPALGGSVTPRLMVPSVAEDGRNQPLRSPAAGAGGQGAPEEEDPYEALAKAQQAAAQARRPATTAAVVKDAGEPSGLPKPGTPAAATAPDRAQAVPQVSVQPDPPATVSAVPAPEGKPTAPDAVSGERPQPEGTVTEQPTPPKYQLLRIEPQPVVPPYKSRLERFWAQARAEAAADGTKEEDSTPPPSVPVAGPAVEVASDVVMPKSAAAGDMVEPAEAPAGAEIQAEAPGSVVPPVLTQWILQGAIRYKRGKWAIATDAQELRARNDGELNAWLAQVEAGDITGGVEWRVVTGQGILLIHYAQLPPLPELETTT